MIGRRWDDRAMMERVNAREPRTMVLGSLRVEARVCGARV
jgi:hypothetical protein